MSSSDESEADPQRTQYKRKRKHRALEDSPASTSSGSPIIGDTSSMTRRAMHSRIPVVDSSDTDNDGSPIIHRHRRKIVRVSSDSDSDSSEDSIIKTSRAGRARQLVSDSESQSDSQWSSDFSENETRPKTNPTVRPQESNVDSDFSDGQSEKCPICLARFRTQEIGTPESCDHTFCLECIQEWSKNMNTCPVDRQEYNLILVRGTLNGKVTKQIPITKPTPQNDVDIIEDPTYCEICGSCDNEDRLLLCDGCDLGFHLYCLNPPLEDIPAGSWYCNYCSVDADPEVELFQLHLILAARRRESNRLIPRTRQSERVRRRIVNNRQQNSNNSSRRQNHLQTNDLDIPNNAQVDTVGSTSSRNTTTRRYRRSRQNRTRTVYEIDPATGETVAVQKKMKKTKKTKRKKTKKKKGDRVPVRPKTVKKRLAQQLGICKPRSDPQHLPDVAIPNPQGRIRDMRFSAGIPNIDLFGNHQSLDYFSEDDLEYFVGSQLLARRAPNQSDVIALRRAVNRKAQISLPETVSSTTDLLDNILSSQEQFLSRNATYSLDPSGKFKIEKKESSKNYIDVNKEKASVKETPYYNNNRNYSNRYQNNRYQNYNRNNSRQNYYSNNQNQNYNNYSEPSSSMGYSRYSDSHNRDNYDCPQDYTQRTLCASSGAEYQENKDKEEPTNESEVDIYSDIETVSTSKVDDDDGYGELMKPPTPPELPDIAEMYPNEPRASNVDEDNDSETDMVIDDEKVQEQESNVDDNKEEAAVTSTVDYSNDVEPPSDFYDTTNQIKRPVVIQSEAVQSSNLDQIKNYQYDDEEDSTDGCPNSNIYSKETLKSTNEMEEQDSDDGCPNFSIYSKESKTVALHTDISISQKVDVPTQDQQIGEISSSPNIESINQQQENTTNYDLQVHYDPEQLYDPEKMYDPEESQEGEEMQNQTVDPNDKYDPEQCSETDETMDGDKISCSDQTYDPEKAFDDDNSLTGDKTSDAEKLQNDISIDTSQNDDRYDPAIPYDDDLTEDRDLPKFEESHPNAVEEQEADISNSNIVTEGNLEEGELEKMDEKISQKKVDVKSAIKSCNTGGLYSDSEDEGVVKIDNPAFAISDINHMTEDISEEERSYTPCMDEKSHKQGLEGLDTELISDEDRNDFDESHELKTSSDQGDALEINAKESELDFTRPEDYEEGEIVDKNKDQSIADEEPEVEPGTPQRDVSKESNHSKVNGDKSPVREKNDDKENDSNNKESSFKKLSKNTKERNYRDKDKEKGKNKDKRLGSSRKSKDREQKDKKEKKKEKRREIERYNVRALIAEKPRSIIAKDQFGRDIRDTPSRSRSRSYTPPIRRSVERDGRSPSGERSLSRRRRSPSRERSLSRRRRSPSKEVTSRKRRRSTSRSRSPAKKRSRSKNKKRQRSPGRFKKRRSSRERTERAKPKKRVSSRSRNRSRSDSALRRQREWEKEWTLSPPPIQSRISPSWTPPRILDNSQVLRNENLTVTLNNTVSGKKKKEKRKKGEKRNKDGVEGRSKKRRSERERTPPPSKEVFASGDNILVSVSFNNENETRDITTREKRKNDDGGKKKKEKKKKNKRDLTGVKPVAIIDLDRSPFRELTPSPKQVIILSDSDNEETANLRKVQENTCDSSQQVASPEHAVNYTMGPKTPPEPQVKFSLNAKPPQVRAINNPLHDPDDLEPNDHVEEELLTSRLSPAHKGPNTPPEPPNSPPSSPDAYDPFEPTKSRSPTPDPMQTTDLSIVVVEDEQRCSLDSRHAEELLEKSTNPMPETGNKSLTPPLADVQPADSQSSVQASPDSNIDKSPERLGVVQSIQPLVSVSKPVAQTTPFSSVPPSMITSTPISSALPPSRVNILNSTVITPTTLASSIPQRIVLPNQVKSSPVKISPTKAAIKSTPIKPMPSKSAKSARKRPQIGNNDDLVLELDSPYSPGSSDYEDLFEPPSEIVTKPVIKSKPKTTQKHGSAFDALFGSPSYKTKGSKDKSKAGKKILTPSKTKTVGVKIDEDNLKILEELPNSAVEMQVKDKFLKKLNRQERVVEEVKLVLKPHYNKKRISKEEYKDILRRSVPKICHNKNGEINPTKIKNLIEAYVRKIKHSKKVTSSSSVNPQKV